MVQPGVEFDHAHICDYQPHKAVALSDMVEAYDTLVFEAHSTDYQTPQALRQLVKDHFAILKAALALTFALREALFSLAAIEEGTAAGEPALACVTCWKTMSIARNTGRATITVTVMRDAWRVAIATLTACVITGQTTRLTMPSSDRCATWQMTLFRCR